MHLVVQFDLARADLAAFDRYEATVLPLLSDHGGVLLQRLRAQDGSREIHVLRFESEDCYETFRNDPRRIGAAGLFAASGVVASVERCDPVPSRGGSER